MVIIFWETLICSISVLFSHQQGSKKSVHGHRLSDNNASCYSVQNLYFSQRLLNLVAIIMNINNSFVTLALN
jgi:hypothetical protein